MDGLIGAPGLRSDLSGALSDASSCRQEHEGTPYEQTPPLRDMAFGFQKAIRL